MSSPFFVNHAFCEACWKKREGNREPFRVRDQKDVCCWCGEITKAGIYLRGSWDICPQGNHSDVA
jgi:hypothetical protein